MGTPMPHALYCPILKTDTLTLAQIDLAQTTEFMFKYINNLPQMFTKQFTQISDINPYNIRSSNNYTSIYCSTNFRQFAIRHMGSITCNDRYHANIRLMNSLHIFKKS